MITNLKLSKSQYRFLASFSRTIAEGVILGSSTAFFLPEIFQIKELISIVRYVMLLILGLTFLVGGAILEKKGEA
ncbi:MAG: hypothetical protein HY427_00225 [Candidatus Levybacteria bacterium]|nr:hypothetical protein [Candidatus Levybacteria bacterium]